MSHTTSPEKKESSNPMNNTTINPKNNITEIISVIKYTLVTNNELIQQKVSLESFLTKLTDTDESSNKKESPSLSSIIQKHITKEKNIPVDTSHDITNEKQPTRHKVQISPPKIHMIPNRSQIGNIMDTLNLPLTEVPLDEL